MISMRWLEPVQTFRPGNCIFPDRPGRRMPKLWTIASYWAQRDDLPLMSAKHGLERPHCFGCSYLVPCDLSAPLKERWNGSSPYLVRAHLADRCLGGLDAPQNIVPLCGPCHHYMPSFEYPDAAIEWVGFKALLVKLRRHGAPGQQLALFGPHGQHAA